MRFYKKNLSNPFRAEARWLTRAAIILIMSVNHATAAAEGGGEYCKQAIDPLLEQANEANDGLILAMVGAAAVLAATTRGNNEPPAQAAPPAPPVFAQPARLIAQPAQETNRVPVTPGTDRVQVGFDVTPVPSREDNRTTLGQDRMIAQPDINKRMLGNDQLQAGPEGSTSAGGAGSVVGGPVAGGRNANGNDQLTYSAASIEGQRQGESFAGFGNESGGGSGGSGRYGNSQMPGMADQTRLAALSSGRAPAAEAGLTAKNDVAKRYGPSLFRINSFVLEKFAVVKIAIKNR